MPKAFAASRRAMLLGAAGGARRAAASPRAQPAPIKLGILQPVTGALAQDGEYGRLGAEIGDQRDQQHRRHQGDGRRADPDGVRRRPLEP